MKQFPGLGLGDPPATRGHNRRGSGSLVNTRHWGFDARRDGQQVNAYVDRYEAYLLAPAMLIVLCSITDAFLTLELIRGGAIELNYLMAHLMYRDLALFVQAKIALTGLSVVFLVVHKNFRVIRGVTVSHLLYLIAALYLLLICYEAMLLGQIVH